jgi:hypothetical protein
VRELLNVLFRLLFERLAFFWFRSRTGLLEKNGHFNPVKQLGLKLAVYLMVVAFI